MKKIATTIAAAALAAVNLAPATAATASAPAWGEYTNFTGTLYGTVSTWDGFQWVAGDITDGDIDLTIHQYSNSSIALISIDLGHQMNLSNYGSITVTGDNCSTGGQVNKVSGDEITIKGIMCSDANDSGPWDDGYIDITVEVRDLTGTTWAQSDFTDQKIESQYRYANNRGRYGLKDPSWRIYNETGLDFVVD